MNTDSELIEYLYHNAQMGAYTLTSLINKLNNKENKIKLWISEHIKEYEKYVKECETYIKKNKLDIKGISLMSKMGSNMGIKMEVIKDNSDSAIASMIIEGITMGITQIDSKINKFSKVASNKILRLSKNYKKSLEKQFEDLKKFL